MADRDRLDLVAWGGPDDTVWTDLRYQRLELHAGCTCDIAELCAGAICHRLGMDLVSRISDVSHLCWRRIDPDGDIHQPFIQAK